MVKNIITIKTKEDNIDIKLENGIDQSETDKSIQFMKASFQKSMEYLKWKNTDYYFKELKMDENNK